MKHSIYFAVLISLLNPSVAFAHHSLAAFDTDIYQTVEGTVKDFLWAFPHTTLVLIAHGPSGEETEWTFEGGSVGRLTRGGFNENTIAPGDKITVSYNPTQNGSIGGFFLAVTTPDGTLYSLPRFRRLYGQ